MLAVLPKQAKEGFVTLTFPLRRARSLSTGSCIRVWASPNILLFLFASACYS